MLIDRALYPITALGPGKRLAIWTVGCRRGCFRCANRELWDEDPSKEIEPALLVSMIRRTLDSQGIGSQERNSRWQGSHAPDNRWLDTQRPDSQEPDSRWQSSQGIDGTATNKSLIDGVTITGGEPLDQIDDLCRLLPLLREMTDDILIYTGYTIEEADKALPAQAWATVKRYTAVLIAGAYVDALNDNRAALVGSTNQEICFLDESRRAAYMAYMDGGRRIQNVYHGDAMISVGIHNRDGGGENGGC